jgi:hypothetical protein
VRPHDEPDRGVEQALARLWHRLPGISEDELWTIAETASSRTRISGGGNRRRRRLGLGTAFAATGIALLVGSGLGFGLGSALTPSGSATALVGFGFIPAQGWNVTQTGTLDANGVARAVAANVPVDPRDDLRGEPSTTLRSLPPRGVLITAVFRPRGDAAMDAAFPVRQPPLLLEHADPVGPGELELHAGIRGYNVVLTIHFGSDEPSARSRAAAQRQLDRLVVAAERVTIFAQPSVTGNQPLNRSVRLFGSIDSNKAGESIAIQAKDCGSNFFRLVAGATTESGGTWSTMYWPAANTTVRAVWNDVSSPQVAIRVRAFVGLYKRRDGKALRVSAGGADNFWRKRVEIQRLDRRLGTWKRLQTVVLTDSSGNRGSGPNTGRSGSSADFVPRVPRGTVLRGVMPLSQAKPCYLSGTSRTLRW